ncbi:tyrosine-type recombinase/integrase [Streptomyces sp. NPDC005393]|uniref:tyrosine-type recombinase/integrase n=1 Tax=Streptomyces sp. NPDC005393 TaxID=3157041 RepID=UPI0033A4A8CE
MHDLRHLAATLSLLAGTDIKVVQEKLGHSSRQITSDTYTSVLPGMMRAEAESVMTVVRRDVPFVVRTPLATPRGPGRATSPCSSPTAHGSRGTTGALERSPNPTPISSA